MPATVGARPAGTRRWPVGLVWAGPVLTVLGLAATFWLDRLLRRAGLAPVNLLGLAPEIGPGVVARGLLTRRIDVPAFATGNGRRASYLGHYRKALA